MPTKKPRSQRSWMPQTLTGFIARLRYAYEVVFYPDVPDDAPPQRKWEASVEGPMLVVSVVFLILFTGAALGKTDAFGTQIAEFGMWVTWIIFVIDYVVRLILANPRGKWFLTHLHELLIVALPWFRPLRILRIVPILFLMQRFSAKNQRVTVAIYTGAGSLLMILVAALSMYDAEYGQPDSHITSFGDALWWSVVTVTTVGYGDITPVTDFGRGVGIFLMVGGIAVAGIVTATVAAWLVQQVEDHSSTDDLQQNLMLEIVALRREIKSLRDEVEAVTGGQSAGGTPQAAPVAAAAAKTEAKKPPKPMKPKAKAAKTRGLGDREGNLGRWLSHFKQIGPHSPVNGSRDNTADDTAQPESPEAFGKTTESADKNTEKTGKATDKAEDSSTQKPAAGSTHPQNGAAPTRMARQHAGHASGDHRVPDSSADDEDEEQTDDAAPGGSSPAKTPEA